MLGKTRGGHESRNRHPLDDWQDLPFVPCPIDGLSVFPLPDSDRGHPCARSLGELPAGLGSAGWIMLRGTHRGERRPTGVRQLVGAQLFVRRQALVADLPSGLIDVQTCVRRSRCQGRIVRPYPATPKIWSTALAASACIDGRTWE